jgi:hypothetical protein
MANEHAQEVILTSCRDALQASGFRFKGVWAKVIPGILRLTNPISGSSDCSLALWSLADCIEDRGFDV